VLVVDGKTLRGARGSDRRPAKLVCVYDHAHRLVLTQTGVVDGDEIAAFTAALSTLPDQHEVLITADALHCQREQAAWLHARGGHYLFTVKSNQPALRRQWPPCRGGRSPASAAGRSATAGSSHARSRS
jgi:hypothetical protein